MKKEIKGADHKNQLSRVNRIEGQIKGVKNMIEDDKYCIDILTQIKAIRSALKGLELQILEGHANHCLMNALSSGSKKETQEKINEVMELIKKSSKS
ncbi:MAG: metal-sensitive transcriptional regulator [Bacteriovoracaceae bacterium]|jgi:DNA-binding FrmR family transcriptional regulator|nr:transcriptional regulator [Halobacteriovoraceae bacterium]MDP7320775.1 metal-sensitive transcriptional regulator [Bacteriovoracaceae bacterium]|tara:strand:- start:183 stop:473 length:291 start_codon:yes stop_codon:yes gene_type:complete